MKHLLFICLLVEMVFLCSCEKGDMDYQYLFPEEYHEILYIKNSGSIDLELPNLSSNPIYEYSFFVYKGGSDPTLSASLSVGVMSQQEVDENYSVRENINYKVLPNVTYSLENPKIDFQDGELYKLVKVAFKPALIKELLDESTSSIHWLLPLKLISYSDSVNSEKNAILLKIKDVNTPVLQFEATQKSFEMDEEQITVTMGAKLEGVTSNMWNISCKGVYADDALQLLTTFNENEVNKKLGCVLLPKLNVEFKNNQFDFSKGNNNSDTSLELVIQADGLDNGVNYLLPIRMTESSESDVFIGEPCYIIISKTLGDNARLILKREMLSSPFSHVSEGNLNNLIDDNPTTFWHSDYSNPHYDAPYGVYIETDLSPLSIQSFAVGYDTRYTGGGYNPMTIELYVNGGEYSDWTLVGELTVEEDGLPNQDAVSFKSRTLKAEKKFTKLRFSVTRNSVRGSSDMQTTGNGWGAYALAEFRLWGI